MKRYKTNCYCSSFRLLPLPYQLLHHPLEGESEAARQLYTYVGLVAPTPMSVLINGASGTGKEYVAHRIHQLSKRADKPFIAIDCGSIPKELAGSLNSSAM